ncbi:MAG: hypothetical protein U5K79_03095 [Cyclobacteriaceae bacterium]|nr:hypothetical protein [Cyclobacteriaceae bacterium]
MDRGYKYNQRSQAQGTQLNACQFERYLIIWLSTLFSSVACDNHVATFFELPVPEK